MTIVQCNDMRTENWPRSLIPNWSRVEITGKPLPVPWTIFFEEITCGFQEKKVGGFWDRNRIQTLETLKLNLKKSWMIIEGSVMKHVFALLGLL